MPGSMVPDLVVDARAILGEGPIWHPREQRLYWVDIEGERLHAHEPNGDPDRVWDIGRKVGAVVPRRLGGLILATDSGIQTFDPETSGRETIADPERHLPHNRFNDGKCDALGRFWIGSMSMEKESEAGSLYVLDRDHSIRTVLQKVTTSNGLDWSPDRSTMYYIDTPTMRVEAFDFDLELGTISNRRVVIEFPDGIGRPDGMTVDAEGMLWIAHWAGGRVSRWDPEEATLLRELRLPADLVTSCAFGGSDLDTLYITTARHRIDAQSLARQPRAGGLFALRPGVRGLPAHEYAG